MRIWKLMLVTPYQYDKLDVNRSMKLHNWDALMAAHIGAFKSWAAGTPLVQLTMTLEEFVPDCFDRDGFVFVSKKMRDAIAQPPNVIEYFDLDPARLVASARAMDYKMMHVFAAEDAIDMTKSEYRMVKYGDRDALPMFNATAIREHFIPRNDIFLDRTYPSVEFCTDALAMRVLKAGCTGIRFVDPMHCMGLRPMRFRTLRGIEESGEFNTIAKTLSTTLVEEIPMLQ